MITTNKNHKKHNRKYILKFQCPVCKKKYYNHKIPCHPNIKTRCSSSSSLNNARRPPPIQYEKVEINIISLNRKLTSVLELLYVQSERIKHMEKMLETKNKTIRNKLKWLIEHVTPDDSFDYCLSNITLNRDHYDYITRNGYLKGYCDIAEEVIDAYKEIMYSFTTSNVIYVYINKNEKWVEFNKNHAFRLFLRIQQKLIDIAYTVEDIPDKTRLMNNIIIYGTNAQSIDIKTKIKTTLHKKTIVGIETLLNRYDIT